MAISKERKTELLTQYGEAIQNSRAMLIADYRGLSTTELGDLRRSVREAEGGLNVVKLTLFKLALEKAGIDVPEDLFAGPVAVGFCYQEIPAMAKALNKFSEDQEALEIKGGIMGDKLLSIADINALAELPPLDVIRGQLLGIIGGPARNLASTVASGVRQVVNVFNAYSDQSESVAA